MVDLEVIQSAYYMVAATGVLVAAVYYILNLRVSQRNQELTLKAQQQTLETRQAQFFTQISQQLNNEDGMRRWIALINMDWSSYDEYEKKYGTDSNPEIAALRLGTLYEWNGIGYLLRKGVIDRDAAYALCNGVSGSWLWRKFEPVIREMRSRYNMPDAYADLEYLAMEMGREAEQRGLSSKVPEGFAHYNGKDSQ
jgi:hypothetical protein